MRRREFITVLGGAAISWPLAARAQQGGRLSEVTVWMGRANDSEGHRYAAAFRERLQALGWTNRRNIRIDYRWVTGDIDRVNLAKEVIEQHPDVILVETTPAVAALSRESSTIPIVFVNVSDPIGAGVVASLAHPGGSITGFISNEPTIGGKWPQLLKEITPGVGRVGFMFNPDVAPYSEAFMRPAEDAARSLGMELTASRVRNDTEIEHAIIALGSRSGGGLIVLPDATTNTRSALIIGLAAQHRLPAIYAWRFQAVGGGLISYGCDLAESFRGGASYVDRILRGEKPATLPVQMPTKFSLVVNLKTAKALGLEVPPTLLARADEVIEL
jgi:putative tryptophan/tyrosine transport system substrate-binding protein